MLRSTHGHLHRAWTLQLHTFICSRLTSLPSWSTAVKSGICTGSSGAEPVFTSLVFGCAELSGTDLSAGADRLV